MPVGEAVWDLCMASAVNCCCSFLLFRKYERKQNPFVPLPSVQSTVTCRLPSLTGGHGVRILELHTPVQMKVWALVIVWLSPNTLCFIPAQGSPFHREPLSRSWEHCELAFSFQAANERPVLIKKGDSSLSQHTAEMEQKHLSHPDSSGSASDFI